MQKIKNIIIGKTNIKQRLGPSNSTKNLSTIAIPFEQSYISLYYIAIKQIPLHYINRIFICKSA